MHMICDTTINLYAGGMMGGGDGDLNKPLNPVLASLRVPFWAALYHYTIVVLHYYYYSSLTLTIKLSYGFMFSSYRYIAHQELWFGTKSASTTGLFAHCNYTLAVSPVLVPVSSRK